MVGVTGTNGKTTVASMLYALFKNLGFKTGLLSTVNIKVVDVNYKATHTTPDSLTINKFLRQMVDDGVSHCFMEVSSHGVAQNRTLGLDFKGGYLLTCLMIIWIITIRFLNIEMLKNDSLTNCLQKHLL